MPSLGTYLKASLSCINSLRDLFQSQLTLFSDTIGHMPGLIATPGDVAALLMPCLEQVIQKLIFKPVPMKNSSFVFSQEMGKSLTLSFAGTRDYPLRRHFYR